MWPVLLRILRFPLDSINTYYVLILDGQKLLFVLCSQIMNTFAKIQRCHDAVRDLEKKLLELLHILWVIGDGKVIQPKKEISFSMVNLFNF